MSNFTPNSPDNNATQQHIKKSEDLVAAQVSVSPGPPTGGQHDTHAGSHKFAKAMTNTPTAAVTVNDDDSATAAVG